MRRVATVILGGGQGARLFPLTTARCKPALCYGGRYRLIDIPISNAYNSGCRKIFIVTQFLATSLHRHIFSTYSPGTFSSGVVELLPSEERPHSKVWFEGTADAVRQNLPYLEEAGADYILILSGDQLYTMDFRSMVQTAQSTGADLVVAALPVDEACARRLGVMQVDGDNFISAFQEKPSTKKDLNQFLLPSDHPARPNSVHEKKGSDYLASMGIYLFRRQALIDLLANDPREDFGKHLIPTKVSQGNIAAHIHHGYWEDIGTIDSFHRANMALTLPNAPFNCYNEEWPIFAKPAILPAARLTSSCVERSFFCEGSMIDAAEITTSLFGPRSIVHSGAIIRDSYIMGNDAYAPASSKPPQSSLFYGIGKNTVISKAIVDKNVTIGDNVRLINKDRRMQYDGEGVFIRDGIIVVQRGAVIPDNFTL